MEKDLENIVEEAPGPAKQEHGKQLDQMLEKEGIDKPEESGLKKASDAIYLPSMALLSTALSTAFVGPLGALIGAGFAGGGLIGNLRKKTMKKYDAFREALKTYAGVNAVISPMVWLGNVTYPLIGAMGSKIAGTAGSMIAKAAYGITAYNAAFVAKFRAAYHMVDRYLNPIGLMKSVKDDFYRFTKRINLGMSPALALTANGLSPYLFAANALPVSYYDATHPMKKNKKQL